MKYFRKPNEKICAFKEDGSQDYLIQDDYVSITEAEAIEAQNISKISTVTMRQARLALLRSGLLATIEDAIKNGTDEEMKIEWEYATEIKRDWSSLIALAKSLNMTEADLDNLFSLASTL